MGVNLQEGARAALLGLLGFEYKVGGGEKEVAIPTFLRFFDSLQNMHSRINMHVF